MLSLQLAMPQLRTYTGDITLPTVWHRCTKINTHVSEVIELLNPFGRRMCNSSMLLMPADECRKIRLNVSWAKVKLNEHAPAQALRDGASGPLCKTCRNSHIGLHGQC